MGQLWNELSEAMRKSGGQENEGPCGIMEDGTATRKATDPEKKACQHLTAGFNKLKELTTNGSPKINGSDILDKNPSLKQAMGCFLLKEYAKQMQKDSKCVIDAGLKKAFKSWNDNKSPCANNFSCIKCEWEEELDNCTINTTKTDGTVTQKKVTEMLKTVLPDNDTTVTDALREINKMQNLCDFIRCAAPKWFKNKIGNKGSPTQTWVSITTNNTTLRG